MPILEHQEAQSILKAAALSGALGDLAERGELRRYAKGSMIIEEGDVGDTLFIVISGRVKAFSAAPNGREVTYGFYSIGEYVGEMSLDGGTRAASVITLEKTVCSLITRRLLEAFIAEHPAFAFDLLSKVIRRARAATLSAKQMALNDVYGRLKMLLESLAVDMQDGGLLIEERLTHQDIASRLGCSREMVSKLMKDLQKGGYIDARKHGLLLPNILPPRW
jgi:CRP/FNR family transcriptional regulator, cyclic AMP receptor protein